MLALFTTHCSVVLASNHPDCVGEVDVIADAKDIKKLLKMPYCSSDISMSVHRIGKTLLVDSFNDPLHYNPKLRSKLQKLVHESWLLPRKKDPAVARHRSMLSKLLYYCMQENPSTGSNPLNPALEGSVHESVEEPGCKGTDMEHLQRLEAALKTEETSSRAEPASKVMEPVTATEETVKEPGTMVEVKSAKDEPSLDKTEKVGDRGHHGHHLQQRQPLPSFKEKVVVESPSAGVGGTGDHGDVPLVAAKSSPQKVAHESSVQKCVGSEVQQQDATRGSGAVSRLMVAQRRDELVPSINDYLMVPLQEGDESQMAFPCPVLEPPPPPPFAKNFQWTIADTRMLLGSDLPILTQGGHPAISLRLREKGMPVTVLTGLDYWLDNLMCNVPEMMMCFHIDGVVQNYEVIKTEEIPHLDKDCQFNPQDVLAVAHNILGFLKANCTQEGHTYWLCRRAGEEVVKLYDLSSLEEKEEGSGEEFCNPFAKSVATLLYRTAKNMLKNMDECVNTALVHMLLDNCIELLKQNTSTKMLVSAYYLQALLVITRVEVTPLVKGGASAQERVPPTKCPSSATPPGAQSTHGDISSSESKCVVVSKLLKPLSFTESEPSLPMLSFSNDQERVRTGLDYIVKALVLLDPMKQWNHWQQTCVAMLLSLSAAAYESLAWGFLFMDKLGRAMRYAKYCILCGESSAAMSVGGHVPGVQLAEKLYSAWIICGDAHCLSTKLSDNFSSHLEDFQLENPEDMTVLKMITNQPVDEKKMACMTLQTDLESSLLTSIQCYELAEEQLSHLEANIGEKKARILEHVGNSWNELGTYYKQLTSLMDYHKDSKQVEKLWLTSHDCFQKSLQKFQEAGNAVNQALVYANLGALMVSCAKVHGQPEPSGQRLEFSQKEKVFYTKAADFYISGKQALKGRSTCPGVWDQLLMDLSGVYFTMGTVLQNNAPLSSLTLQDVEREVVEALMKALSYTETILNTVDKEHPKYVALSAQAGNCHYQLASLYQKSAYGFSSTQSKQRQSKIQAEKHYNKALQLYLPHYHTAEMLRANMEKALLYEQQAQGKQQVKYLKCVLGCLLDCETILPEKDEDTDSQLITVMIHRLQAVLKQLVNILAKRGESPQLLQQLKLMYTNVLKPEQYKNTRELVSALKSLYQQVQK